MLELPYYFHIAQGKPFERRGRKATGATADLPPGQPAADMEADEYFIHFFRLGEPCKIHEMNGGIIMKLTRRIPILFLTCLLIVMSFSTPSSYAQGDTSLLKDIVILPQGNYDKLEADKMMNHLALIPAPLLQALKDKQINIKLVAGKITDEPEFSQYKGVTPRGWENTGLTWDDVPGVSSNIVIARIGYSDKGKGHNGQNLELHETFHAIDRLVLGNISSSSKFTDIWKKEADIDYKGDGYVSAYPTEYFAETATLYLYSEQTQARLKQDMPLTYQFMKDLFSKYQ